MPLPTHDTTYVATGNSRMIGRYQTAPVVAGINKALMLRCQELEDELFLFMTYMQLKNQPNADPNASPFLDQLGAIVGEPRKGRADGDYVSAIKLRIRVNRSNGLAEDIIQIAQLVVSNPIYRDEGVAGFVLEAFNITSAAAQALLTYLHEARSAGTDGQLSYTTAPGGFIMGSTTAAPVVGASLLGDHIAGGTTPLLGSRQEI